MPRNIAPRIKPARSSLQPARTAPAAKARGGASRPTESQLAQIAPIPEVLRPNLDILFVGINPGVMSGQKQLHFGNPQNYFWKGLFQSGLIPRSIAPEEGHLLWTSWNMSIVNLVQRTTPSASDLSRQEMRDAVPDLCRKISESAPRIVCFVGIGIYATFAAQSNTTPGLQPVVYSLEPAASGADKSTATSSNAQQPPLQPLTPDKTAHQGMLGARPPFAYLFVMPSTSGRTTTYQNRDKLMFLKQLKYVRDCVAPASPESPPRPIDHDVLDDLGPKTRSKYF